MLVDCIDNIYNFSEYEFRIVGEAIKLGGIKLK